MKSGIILVLLFTFIFSLVPNSPPKNPMILQISTRPYLYELSKQRGMELKTLKDIPDDVISDFKSKGFDYIWFMGVWQVGRYGVNHDRTSESLVKGFKELLPDYVSEDAIGSPYAIVDYYCNKELCPNGDDDLKQLKQRLNDKGLKLILDFVPNHSAFDSPWVREDMDYYVRAPEGTKDKEKYFDNGLAYGNMQYSSPWTDVAQLNYFNPKLRELMTKKLKYAVSMSDGVRCDMAYIVLNNYFYGTWRTELDARSWRMPSTEFWEDAIKAVKAEYPQSIFIAEVYGDAFKDLVKQGFDYVYDKELLDRFKNGHLDNLRGWIQSMIPYNQNVCRFIENHDDNRAMGMFQNNYVKTNAAALGTYTLPGLRFFFQDQWNCFRNKLDVHLRRSKDEEIITQCNDFYDKFIPIINSDVIKYGEWTYLNVGGAGSWRLMAWKWVYGSEKYLVVLNFSDEQAYGTVVLSDLSGSGSVQLKELLTGAVYDRDAEEIRTRGLGVVLYSFQGQIFKYE